MQKYSEQRQSVLSITAKGRKHFTREGTMIQIQKATSKV